MTEIPILDVDDRPLATPALDSFGDEPLEQLPLQGRKALVTLLSSRFISKSKTPEVWASLLAYEPEIRARLAELFLELHIDTDYNVAFKRHSGEDDVPILLRKEKPLSRDSSFLLIFLRMEHAFTDADDDAIVVTRTQIAEFLGRFHDDSGSDEVRSHRRVNAAITAIERIHLLTVEPDDPELFIVSPAIVPLITTTELAHFERIFAEQSGRDAVMEPSEEQS